MPFLPLLINPWQVEGVTGIVYYIQQTKLLMRYVLPPVKNDWVWACFAMVRLYELKENIYGGKIEKYVPLAQL